MEQRIRLTSLFLVLKYCSRIKPGAYCTENGYMNINWKED